MSARVGFLLSLFLTAMVAAGCSRREEGAEANTPTVVPTAGSNSNQPTASTEPPPASSTSSGDTQAVASGNDGGPQTTTDALADSKSARAEERPVWRVLSVSGEWVLDDTSSVSLSRGQALESGKAIRLKSQSEAGSYVTLIDQHNRIVRKRCASPGDCDKAWKLPSSSGGSSSDSRIISAAMEVWKRNPGKYKSLISRGGTLHDAVVELRNGQLDLRPVFENNTEDRYVLRFQPISVAQAKSAGSAPPDHFVFNWEPQKPSAVSTDGMTPGLYKLIVLDDSEERLRPTDNDAWVLISAPGKYERDAAAYRKAVALTNRWGDDAGADLAQNFRRAYLDYLAARVAK